MKAYGGSHAVRVRGLGITVLRVVVGAVFVMHGLQKFLGTGIGDTGLFFEQLGIPAPEAAAVLVAAFEVLGGLALVAGALTRPVALVFAVEMLVAAVAVHLENGFYVAQNGVEFVLTLAAACVALALTGAGELAVDTARARRVR